MKVARRELARQGHPIAAADLVAMVTSVAARLAGLDEHLGSVAVGRPADLVVLERHHPDPYENVCLADPSWVDLVCIGGDVTYARADWFGQLSGPRPATTIEDLTAWGKPMRLDTGFQGGSDVPFAHGGAHGSHGRLPRRGPDLRLTAYALDRPRRVPRDRPNTIRTRPGPMLHLRGGM